jgi:hypothetical protein
MRCRRCKELKPRDGFWPNPKISTGLSPWCKACSLEASRRSRERYRERYNARRRKPPSPARTCPVCGRTFKPTHHGQVYCPPTDLDRARANNSQPRSRCAKRADNAKQRGWDPSSRPLLEPFDCAWCGKRCVPGQNVAAHATRFCSKAHKRAFHHAADRAAA